jgi:uncharacterized protein YlzI (FlbEa/FlbD family)
MLVELQDTNGHSFWLNTSGPADQVVAVSQHVISDVEDVAQVRIALLRGGIFFVRGQASEIVERINKSLHSEISDRRPTI